MAKGIMGRKPKSLEIDKLKTLMRLNPTLADTAAFFEVSERCVERNIRRNFDLTFVEFRLQNMVHTRLDLIRECIKQAKSGNTAALIFSLKNLCGWSDKHESNVNTTSVIKIDVDDKNA